MPCIRILFGVAQLCLILSELQAAFNSDTPNTGTSPNYSHFGGREFKEGDRSVDENALYQRNAILVKCNIGQLIPKCYIYRVVITSSSRKMNQAVVGKDGQVTQVLTNGWVNIFIPSLKLNEQVQQRYLAHIEPGRVVRSNPAHPAQQTATQQQPFASEAALITDFPELPHDLDGLVGGLDGDLFLESSHPMSLGEPRNTAMMYQCCSTCAAYQSLF